MARTASSRVSCTVAILGGDPIVGRVLEAMLEADGLPAWFMDEDAFLASDGAESLAEVQLLLISSGLSPKCRAAARESIQRTRVEIAVLEIFASSEETPVGTGISLPWPCRAEDLRRLIDAALHARPPGATHRDDSRSAAGQKRKTSG